MQGLVFIAVDPEGQRREWPLEETSYLVGRDDGSERPGRLAIPGDRHLSRSHFTIEKSEGRLLVNRCEGGRNPLFFQGQEQDTFLLEPGQVFYSGKTQFGVVMRAAGMATAQFTLARQAKEQARLRRLQDCFSAVLELLAALRTQREEPPWRVAFPVVRSILPDVRQLVYVQVPRGASTYHLLDHEPRGQHDFNLRPEMLQEALKADSTVTFVWDEAPEADDGATLGARYSWAIASPIRGLEASHYLLCGFGESFLERPALEERAAIIDIVAELVGHHQVTQQAAEYSSLLGVFGHHVGTLFKTSGALKLWSSESLDPETKRVLDNLLPIWGISQAISLHKKQGEKDWAELLRTWVRPSSADDPNLKREIQAALEAMADHIYRAHEGEAFLPWSINGRPPAASTSLKTLPPLDDNPRLFDKTLALAIGLLEMLNNVRKYPEARGAGREDRRELAELEDDERRVEVHCRTDENEAVIEVLQPVVTAADGTIPRSGSLARIRSLEMSLLGGLVETGESEVLGPTSLEHIVRVRQRWTYRWGQMLDDWRKTLGAQAATHVGR